MPLTSDESLNLVLALARRVKTQAGVKLYNQPIGSIINPDDTKGGGSLPENAAPKSDVKAVKEDEGASRAPSLVRIRSLLSQMKRAVKMGDDSQADLLKKQLSEAISAYAKGKDMGEVMKKIEGTDE